VVRATLTPVTSLQYHPELDPDDTENESN
jgi:hypothetical protein